MTTATVCSVRIPKADSNYVQLCLTYEDDKTRVFYAEGEKYDLAILSRDIYEKDKDKFTVGSLVQYWYSSSVKDGKTRWFLNVQAL